MFTTCEFLNEHTKLQQSFCICEYINVYIYNCSCIHVSTYQIDTHTPKSNYSLVHAYIDYGNIIFIPPKAYNIVRLSLDFYQYKVILPLCYLDEMPCKYILLLRISICLTPALELYLTPYAR